MKKIVFLLNTAVMIWCVQSCKYAAYEAFWRKDPVDSRATEILLLQQESNKLPTKGMTALPSNRYDIAVPKKYDCILIADHHFGHEKYDAPEKLFFDWLEKECESRKKDSSKTPFLFCITLGDLVDHGTEKEYERFKRFQTKLNERGIPVYNVLGNHDVFNSGYRLWEKTCYPHKPAYWFKTPGFDWYFLDSASGTIGRPQFYDLKQKLQKSTKSKLVFTHYAIHGDGIFYFALCNPQERAALISLFGKTNVKLYCAGHYHKGADYDFGCFKEKVLKAFGLFGAWYILHVDETDTNNPSFTIEKVGYSSKTSN